MTAELLVLTLARAQFAAGAAILLVLAIRPLARRLLGAEFAYRLWVLAPVAGLTSLFPSLADFAGAAPAAAVRPPFLDGPLPHSDALLALWATGAAVTLALFAAAEARFRRLARQGLAGPAVVGLTWPRMVTPSDYAQRFDAAERDFIRRHERAHIARHDPQANGFVAAMQALFWFNPLVHAAAAAVRLDQELACDAAVVERRPEIRRAYAATLMKAHLTRPDSRLACAWAAAGRHPLETRIRMLSRPSLSLGQYLAGAAAVLVAAVSVALAIWGLSPEFPLH